VTDPSRGAGPALGLLELTTVARGIVAADAMLKRAPAMLLSSRTLSGGKHMLVVAGGVAEVEEAIAAGRDIAGDRLRDQLILAYADPQVWPMLDGAGLMVASDWNPDQSAESVAIVETATVCAAIAAADAACKVADVIVRDVRLAIDLAGKAYFTMTGALDAIDAAVIAATAAAGDRLVELERIAQPAPELRGRLFR
jgi:microcompartment protein CcmL/EutN